VEEIKMLSRIRKAVVEPYGKVKARRASPVRSELRRQLDDALLGYRAARMGSTPLTVLLGGRGWLRTIRQAAGFPVQEAARRLGVVKWEVFRLEKAEREGRIVLATLQRAARALDCELVYAVVPVKGSLEDLATAQFAELEKDREAARQESKRRTEEMETKINWRKAMQKALRRALRRELRRQGIRVR